MSHPVWVRGLKRCRTPSADYLREPRSHPVWVRGLKQLAQFRKEHFSNVAPRVGAWIETREAGTMPLVYRRSHPVWVRGLKPD